MTTASAPRIAAIIPVGTLAGAKTRLGESLDAEERETLVVGLLARTVVAALAVERLDDVLVASPDRDVLRRAADLGARTLRQRTSGLNAGLSEARDDVVAGGAEAILVLPIDLPFVTPAAVAALLEPLRDSPTVVLGTDRHGTGTNALALRPPDVIAFAFGPDSRRRHRDAAEAARAAYTEIAGPLTVDLDTPEDLVYADSINPAVVGAD
jgi:2-phospho-L-lactate guanylyltransferase